MGSTHNSPYSGRCPLALQYFFGNARVEQHRRIPENGAPGEGAGKTALGLSRRNLLRSSPLAGIHAACCLFRGLRHVNFPCPAGTLPHRPNKGRCLRPTRHDPAPRRRSLSLHALSCDRNLNFNQDRAETGPNTGRHCRSSVIDGRVSATLAPARLRE